MAVIVASGSVDGGEMVRTDPGHLFPPLNDAPSHSQAPATSQPKLPQVVMRDAKKSWRQGGKIDRVLSLACRRGRFKEVRPMQFRAIFPDDVLGVAFGHGLNLFDPDHLAKAEMTYLFRFAGSTDCEVLTRKNEDPSAAPRATAP